MNNNTQHKIEELMGTVDDAPVIAVDHTKVHDLVSTAEQVARLGRGQTSLEMHFPDDGEIVPVGSGPVVVAESNPAGEGHELVKEQYARGESPVVQHIDDFGYVSMDQVVDHAEAVEREVEAVFNGSEPPVEAPSGKLSPENDAIQAGLKAGLLQARSPGKTSSAPQRVDQLTKEQMEQLIKKFPQLKPRLKKALKKARQAAAPSWRRP